MASLIHRKRYLRRINALSFKSGLAWIPANGAILAFSGLALLNALIYGFGFLPVANLLSLYQSPLLNLHTFPHGGVPGLVRMILAFVASGLVYWRGWRIACGLRGRAAWVILLGSSLADGMIFLFLYPFGAADIFDNILRGRILGIYAANPFLPITSKYAADPFYKYIAWKGRNFLDILAVFYLEIEACPITLLTLPLCPRTS